MHLNQVELLGNLGSDPEIRSLNNGKEVANLRLATTQRWNNEGGDLQERTQWHTVTVFSEPLVKLLKSYARKGNRILVKGQLEYREWTDKDQQKRISAEVVLRGYDAKVILLDRNETAGDGASPAQQRQGAAQANGHSNSQANGYARSPLPPMSNDIDEGPFGDVPF
ncbi:single-stranded DNA-binding protein [Sphingosinicella sp. BN140058]|uniref:single-stranded DNA-binding protein n=1 Tax=Sphingosinicella sp. BN140058 TaxID=1892855 RepID=UPI0010125D2F|nr:single-stranded DNA-binding protein [Sphingosinicella sp. BN140058]QAY80466.1 single-stranded DNA-binding protein [Sphingosinicella sp. BN140058]